MTKKTRRERKAPISHPLSSSPLISLPLPSSPLLSSSIALDAPIPSQHRDNSTCPSPALPFPRKQASTHPAGHIFFPWLWWQVPCRFREIQSQECEDVGRGSRRGPSLWLLPVQKSQGNTSLPGSYPHPLSRHLPAWGQGPLGLESANTAPA